MNTLQIKNELQELAENGNDVTLQNIKSNRMRSMEEGWHDWHYSLTDNDIDSISSLLGGRYRTQNIIANKLRSLSTLPSNWCFDRIYFCKHSKRWAYCAGQDYPSELATIRKWFLSL